MLQINSKAPSRHRPRIGMDRAGKKWDAPGFTDWEWDAPICKIDTPRWWGSSSGLNGRSLGDGRVVWRARAVALLMRACVCALVYMEYCGGSLVDLPLDPFFAPLLLRHIVPWWSVDHHHRDAYTIERDVDNSQLISLLYGAVVYR
jgi:hypothetical protein